MEGGNDCDSNAEGLKNRKKGEDARLGDGRPGTGREEREGCKSRKLLAKKKKKKGERRGEKEGVREWSEQKM